MLNRVLLINLLFVSVFETQSVMGQVNQSELQSAFRGLEMSCLRNKAEPRTQKWSGSCFCLSNTLKKEMGGLSSETALKEIEWAKAVFDQTLTFQEFGQDPLNLVGTLEDILSRCEQPTGK